MDAMERLDPKGDLVLVVGDQQLLVSSRVLELSSPFFRSLLQPNAFAEGAVPPNAENPPTKYLRKEEDPKTFALMCRVLHFMPVPHLETVEEAHLLADRCDYYGCSRPLSSLVTAWMDTLDLEDTSFDVLQSLLWVAFVFNLELPFERICLYLAETLTIPEWKDWDVSPMPAQLKGKDHQNICLSQTNGYVSR